MSMHFHSDNGSSLVPHDHADQDERAVVADPPARRLVSIGRSKTFTLLVIATGVMGLICFALYISKRDQEHANDDLTDESVVVRLEVVRVWLPRALVDLAKHEPPTGPIRTHADLTRLLELRGQEKIWYAMKMRAHDRNGDSIEIPFVRQPYREPDRFPELLEILSIATGYSPGELPEWFSNVSFGLLPESVLKRNPRDAVADLLKDPAAQRIADFAGAHDPHGPL
jgi:hypothetical protein